jgi:membrane fusion protein
MSNRVAFKSGNASLFRDEALEASVNRYGAPIRSYGVASWVLTGFIVSVVVSGLIFICVARYARKETVVGSLVPTTGAQTLVASRSGIVDTVHVSEGGVVAANAPLVSITYGTLGSDGQDLAALRRQAADSEAEALAGQSRSALNVLRGQAEELEHRSRGVGVELAQLRLDEEIAAQRVRLTAEALDAAKVLQERGLMAATQLRQREEAWLAARQQQSSLLREHGRLQSEIEQIGAQQVRLAAERDQIASTSAQRVAQYEDQKADRLGSEGQLITARRPGRVASLTVRPGASVEAGQVIGVVLPAGTKLEAELWVPSRSVGFLREQGSVRLLYDAYPYQRFGAHAGQLKYLSQSPSSPPPGVDPSNSNEPMYRAVVTLDRQSVTANGDRFMLTPGMRLTADLVLDERPLIVWLLEPLLATHMRNRS